MTAADSTNEPSANRLCKACGLCCTGHLFVWTKLRSAELDSVEALGVKVFRSVPRQRGFNQPCPLWDGECTIYESTSYPRFCQAYKCKLLKRLQDEAVELPDALDLVSRAKVMIQEVEAMLPGSTNANFRERLVSQMEANLPNPESPQKVEFLQRAQALLAFYEQIFGVDDLIETPPGA